MPIIDVLFPVLGTTVPTDHLYPLYSALTKAVPAFHKAEVPLRFAPIRGQYGGKGLIRLFEGSRLRLRLPSELLPRVLSLAGKALAMGTHRIRLGAPHTQVLLPASSLAARVVTFKHSTEADRFQEVARQKLDAIGVGGEVVLLKIQSAERRGQPRRQVVRIRDRRVIGFGLCVTGLSPAESLALQEKGLGGRTRMGCGFFVPVQEKEANGEV